jgi:NAD(P)-dependent dehydrogenase (short-subunit alcohol dehydrogenase family)
LELAAEESSDMTLDNRPTAVVTGASSGFGRRTAELLLASGWRVYATMRNVSSGNASFAAGLTAAGADVVELDVTSDDSVDAAAARILDCSGAPDLVVNNAGNGFFGAVETFTPDAVQRQFATNVFGPLRVNRAFLPSMRDRKTGLIVYISSIVGRLVFPFGGVYASSKWALEALAESSSLELGPFGIDVTIVQPGAFATEIFGKITAGDDEARAHDYDGLANYRELLNASLQRNAAGRDPGDVARAVLALANAPAGSRPLRVVVPAGGAAEEINAAIAPIQRAELVARGVGDLLPKSAAT